MLDYLEKRLLSRRGEDKVGETRGKKGEEIQTRDQPAITPSHAHSLGRSTPAKV